MKTPTEQQLVPLEQLRREPSAVIDFSLKDLPEEISGQIGVNRERLEELCQAAGIGNFILETAELDENRLTCVSTRLLPPVEDAERRQMLEIEYSALQILKELSRIEVTLQVDANQVNKWIADRGLQNNAAEEWIKYLDQQIVSAISEKGESHLLTPGGLSVVFSAVWAMAMEIMYLKYRNPNNNNLLAGCILIGPLIYSIFMSLISLEYSNYRIPLINIAGIEIDRFLILFLATETRGAVLGKVKESVLRAPPLNS